MDGLTFEVRVNGLEKDKGYKDADLARQIGKRMGSTISVKSIKNYKKNPRTMPYWVLQGMCKALGCRIEYLTEGRNTEEETENAIRWIRKAMKGEE